MPDHTPGFPGTAPERPGEAYAKVAVYEILLGNLHEKAGEYAHFQPQGHRPVRPRAIVEPQYGEAMADGDLGLDVASRISEVRTIGKDERRPDLYLPWSRDERRKRLDVREPSRDTLPDGRSRRQQAQDCEAQDERHDAGAIRRSQEPPPRVRQQVLRLTACVRGRVRNRGRP